MRGLVTGAMVALILTMAGSGSTGIAQPGCASPQEARQLLQQRHIMPLPDAMRRAGVAAEVLTADLCRRSQVDWDYRVQLRQNGQITSTTIPAN